MFTYRGGSNRKTRRRSRSPSPGKGATREQKEVFYLARLHKTLKGSPLKKAIKDIIKRTRQTNRSVRLRTRTRSKSTSKSRSNPKRKSK